MTYVVRRIRDGKFATKATVLHGYSRDIAEAKVYETTADAEQDLVHGERIEQLDQVRP